MKFFKRVILFCVLCSFLYQNNLLFSYVKDIDLVDRGKQSTFLYRSMLYPGLGQFYMGKRTKGVTFISLTTLFISGAIFSYTDSEKKHKNYLNSLDEDFYCEYSRGRDQMFVFLGLTLLNWICSILDISYDLKHTDRNSKGLDVVFDRDNNRTMVTYSKIY